MKIKPFSGKTAENERDCDKKTANNTPSAGADGENNQFSARTHDFLLAPTPIINTARQP